MSFSIIQPPFSINSSFFKPIINGLGDSIIGSQSQYGQSQDAVWQSQLPLIPAWTTGLVYVVGNLVTSSGFVYHCTTGGTAGATPPSGTSKSPVSDGGASWLYIPVSNVNKGGTSMLAWADRWLGGRIKFDLTLGYGGIPNAMLRCIIVNGGSNYLPSDTVTFNNGATGTLNVTGGKIRSVTITNPGYSSGGWSYTINTSTGSGAILSISQSGSGTWGVPGCQTKDMVARLPDVLANPPGFLLVHGGTNDAANIGSISQVSTTISNLQTIYETCMQAGIVVVAMPILPSSTTTHQTLISRTTTQRINRWIRAYCSGASWANPRGFKLIALADPTVSMTDGTNGAFSMIGSTGGVANAMTQDGVHPSVRGAQIMGYTIAKSIERFCSVAPFYPSRACSADDGYDSLLNPGGNMIEGLPWQSSTAYVPGQQVSNNNNFYRCIASGTSASSGGPTTNSASITDGSVTWAYMGPNKTSVCGAGSSGTLTSVAGVTSGSVATGYILSRAAGTATGSVTAAVENPWSSGQTGQRQSIVFSLGSGGTSEQWILYLDGAGIQFPTFAQRGVQSSELASTLFEAEMELEVTGVANLNWLEFTPYVDGTAIMIGDGPYLNQVGEEMMNSSTEPLCVFLGNTWPNGGKILLRTPPYYIPSTAILSTTCAVELIMGFNASGGAASATATIKINYVRISRANQY